MDNNRFDDLVKKLAERPSRRGVIKALIAAIGFGGVAELVIAPVAVGAAECHIGGRTCIEVAECCSFDCGEPDWRGRRRCSDVQTTTTTTTTPAPCQPNDAPCEPLSQTCCSGFCFCDEICFCAPLA